MSELLSGSMSKLITSQPADSNALPIEWVPANSSRTLGIYLANDKMGQYFCCSTLETRGEPQEDAPEVLGLPVLPRSFSERTLPVGMPGMPSTPPPTYGLSRG